MECQEAFCLGKNEMQWSMLGDRVTLEFRGEGIQCAFHDSGSNPYEAVLLKLARRLTEVRGETFAAEISWACVNQYIGFAPEGFGDYALLRE